MTWNCLGFISKVMKIFDNKLYQEDLDYICGLDLPWEKLQGKSVLVSGGSGMIGSCFIDALMKKSIGCKVYALGRNAEKAKARFDYCWSDDNFKFISCDINKEQNLDIDKIDYVIHLASNTHPVAYATEPVNTILTNMIGLRNMLDFAQQHNCERFAFASSNEIYGENRGDVELFDENYCGYINSNTMRAGYPESKRCGEALCQAYAKQYEMDVVIPRFTRSYGPTLLSSDTKALSQFLRNGLNKEDIVLKSEGRQFFSYTYVADAVAGLMYVLLKGEKGEAYNIADEPSDIILRDLAKLIADDCGTNVIFDLPSEIEAAGFSKATKARLDGLKLKTLGWRMAYPIEEGIKRTLSILR